MAASIWNPYTTVVNAGPCAPICVKDAPYNAKGDGIADDTEAIQAALDTGKNVLVPSTEAYYRITAALQLQDNQTFFGEGPRSEIRQTTEGQNVIVALAKTRASVKFLGIYCTGAVSSYISDNGIVFQNSSGCTASHNYVQNHRGAGIHVYNSTDCTVSSNALENSPVQDLEPNSMSLADIAVTYSSSRTKVCHNTCASGQATGILVQTVLDADTCEDVIVTDNTVRNCKAYGIISYRVNAVASLRRTIISNNTISNISGTILTEAVGQYAFGAGIYIQGAEDSIVSGNTLYNTHSGAVAHYEQLAPGAIGITNVARVTVVGNSIDTAGEYGIHAGDPNTTGVAVGLLILEANNISNTAKTAIKILNRGRVLVQGNTIDTVIGYGIWVANTLTQRPDITITSNSIRNIVGVAGIYATYTTNCVVTNNSLADLSIHGIAFDNSTDVVITGNTISDVVSRGITLVDNTVIDAVIKGNTILGTGATSEGIRLNSPCLDYSGNSFTGCFANIAGTYAPWQTLAVNSSTPSVAGGTEFLVTNTVPTSLTSFSSAVDGKQIFVVFTNANTTIPFSASNLKGNGGVDRLMLTNDAIHAIYRAAASGWYVEIIAAS